MSPPFATAKGGATSVGKVKGAQARRREALPYRKTTRCLRPVFPPFAKNAKDGAPTVCDVRKVNGWATPPTYMPVGSMNRSGLFREYEYIFHCWGSRSFCFIIPMGSGVMKRPIVEAW